MHRELLQKINIKNGEIIDKFPLKELLENSLYYPACGRDGYPVWYAHREIQSFFYVDYGATQKQIEASYMELGIMVKISLLEIVTQLDSKVIKLLGIRN